MAERDTIKNMSANDQGFTIQPAAPTDEWAVRQLFGNLHAFNAQLDPRFSLAEGWERVLGEHLSHVQETGLGLTLLAWRQGPALDVVGASAATGVQPGEPVGLLMMVCHTDTPLFRHRHWAELLALYVSPLLRGSDLAEQLVGMGATWAHERGYERVQLYVTASNVRAKRFYTRAGFQPTQEIWRLELGAAEVDPPADPACEATYAHGDDLLSPHQHHLLHEHEQDKDEA